MVNDINSSDLDFENYIYLWFEDGCDTLVIGSEEAFSEMAREYDQYYTKKELFDKMVNQDEFVKINRNTREYYSID